MKTKSLILALAVAVALFLGAAGLGFAADDLPLPRSVLSGGASDSAGGNGTTLRATLGQPLVGDITGGAVQPVTLAQGFWHGISGYDIYLPLVLR